VLEPERLLATNGLEQELQNFYMSFGFSQRLAPGIESVPPQEEGARIGAPGQRRFDCPRQPGHVLIVLENRDPLAVLVAGDAAQPFEHLIPVDAEAAGGGVEIREQRAPHGVRVQNRAGAAKPRDRQVQARFRRGRAASPSDDRTLQVDRHDIRGTQGAFVATAGGNGEAERPPRDYGAEVAAGAERPSAGIKALARLGECPGELERTAVHRFWPS
jgi:hypothetical protein